MSPKAYYSTAGTVFLIVTLVHLLRVINGWEVNIHTFAVPMWLSWVAVFLAGYMAIIGLLKNKR
jgi:hypothetical protein